MEELYLHSPICLQGIIIIIIGKTTLFEPQPSLEDQTIRF
jgi:hypothetical protein